MSTRPTQKVPCKIKNFARYLTSRTAQVAAIGMTDRVMVRGDLGITAPRLPAQKEATGDQLICPVTNLIVAVQCTVWSRFAIRR